MLNQYCSPAQKILTTVLALNTPTKINVFSKSSESWMSKNCVGVPWPRIQNKTPYTCKFLGSSTHLICILSSIGLYKKRK